MVLGSTFLRAWHTQYTYDPATQLAQIGFAVPAASTTPSTQALQPIATAGRKMLGPQEQESAPRPVQPRIFPARIPSAAARGLPSRA